MHADLLPQDEMRAKEAAHVIWFEPEGAESMLDPLSASFARAFIDELADLVKKAPAATRKMMAGAARAAESMNVGRFQGLVECVQNADDVRATEVRFAVRVIGSVRQLLIVHDGQPVTFHHVLSMALPFMTTKTDRDDQRGRFGIGLKTLKRIAHTVAVHSGPYHFSGDQLSFGWVEPQAALPGFYDPGEDTLISLCLKDEVNDASLQGWFGEWREDGLMFLESVHSFRHCTVDGETISERVLHFGRWENLPVNASESFTGLQGRTVQAGVQAWNVWRATFAVPEHLAPAHKIRSDTTVVSVAVCDQPSQGNVYIGFKTRIPCAMPFSLDAQFDPGTSRESMIEGDWNGWLVAQCGVLLSEVVLGLLKTCPQTAWYLIPLNGESVGAQDDRWLGQHFTQCFGKVRDAVCASGLLHIDGMMVGVENLAFAGASVDHLLTPEDILALRPDKRPLPPTARDPAGRWRAVLEELEQSVVVDAPELLRGFELGIFKRKPPAWWPSAGRVIVEEVSGDEETAQFGNPFLLSDIDEPMDCYPAGATACPLILHAETSPFAVSWQLYKRLHPIYSNGEDAGVVMKWLSREAAFAEKVGAEADLNAFAEKYGSNPIAITFDRLRQLRDRFDEVRADKAEELGLRVGAGLLLEGFAYVKGRKVQKMVSPPSAYLSKTLDGEHAYWPLAAGTASGLDWISSRYDEQLKTSTRGARRRTADGIVSRGARKFLMLLGAETAPRLVRTEPGQRVSGVRSEELRSSNANQVAYDLDSVDLNRVLAAIRSSKKEAKARAPALLRALSRNWQRVFQHQCTIPSQFKARTLTHARGPVTAQWLLTLRETEWIPVGRGTIVTTPVAAVLKSPETIDTYEASAFAFDIEASDIEPEMAAALGLISGIRVSDLVGRLREMRDTSQEQITLERVIGLYRAIARQIPANANYQTMVGDMDLHELRAAFNKDTGLIYTGAWRRATEVWRGKDIFRCPDRFVYPASGLTALWSALNIDKPTITHCVDALRQVASGPVGVDAKSMLIDIYHYITGLAGDSSPEKSVKAKLRQLPLVCRSQWTSKRPIYYIENGELRAELVRTKTDVQFWEPPCDTRALGRLLPLIGIIEAIPVLEVVDDREAALLCGERVRNRFRKAVECLSDQLALSDSETHSRLSISWEQLKALPLYVYEGAIKVRWTDNTIPGSTGHVQLQALLLEEQRELHICEESLEQREQGGRVIAQLFPSETRHWIEAEWFAAWHKSRDVEPEGIQLATDIAAIRKRMQEQADEINTKGKKKGEVRVKRPIAKRADAPPPRTLKSHVGAISGAAVNEGQPPKQDEGSTTRKKNLRKTAPTPRPRSEGPPPAATAYSTQELEDRGWALVMHALNDFDDPKLVDFRNRQGVGADGAIDWKTFVELKATGREPQSSIEMSTAEYERAKERGPDYVLALASGMEEGMRDEVRLIFDPVGVSTVKPVSGVRLTRLLEAPCVTIHFEQAADEAALPPKE
ncbi:sacsin N-terminal ATP-binding-like domain-containing protein [Cupriavidus oxalaticus]|uniref:sacsin N-terminal ATP-binding-like domain-containing protein n=1 Tax=Cupriavidus oxalaticus TaxID=96344 RepID=UPI004033203A